MRAIFLDRDGVLNIERGEYTYLPEDFEVIPNIIPVLQNLKHDGFKLIVITNQAGIAKGIYTREQMNLCHDKFQTLSNYVIDDFYVACDHPSVSESLSRKPNSLMFERAITKHNIDPTASWMVGDKERDLIPARKLNVQTVLFGDQKRTPFADFYAEKATDLLNIIK